MNSKWDYQTIGDVCTVERGGSPRPIDDYITESSDGINWIKIGDTDDSMYITKTAQKIRPEGMKKSRYVQPGDFLLSNSMSFGRPYILKIDGCIHDGWLVLRDNNNRFDKRFLYYYLSSKTTYQRFKAMAVGGVVNNLNSEMVRKVSVPIPCMNEQSEIADLLDSVNNVIQERNRELALFDDLIKARFVEMFGNPLDGSGKYPIHQVGNVAETIDPQPSHRTPPEFVGGVPYISIKDCDYKTGKIDFDGARKVNPSVLDEHLARYTLQDGDFIIGKIGTIGNPVFVPSRNDYTLSANVVLVQPNRELVSPYFLKYSFESDYVERQFAEAKNSTSQAAFGILKVRSIEVMNPDLKIQRCFEEFVKQVDKSKSVVQKSLEETQLLFDSLMQEYFG